MKSYKTLLFDLDDTLLDFGATEDVALHKLFDEQKIKLTKEIKSHYKVLNDSLWKAYEKGEIEREEVVNTRFSLLFKEYGLEVDGEALERAYRIYLADGHHLIEGAFELIQNLHEHFDLYVVTNGESNTQYKRLKDSGLAPFFKGIFVSEDTGFQKPMKEFFDHVFDRIEHFEIEKTLLIGDSLSADIAGGFNASIDTCWVNIKEKVNHTKVIPTYEIKKLDELYEVLKIDC